MHNSFGIVDGARVVACALIVYLSFLLVYFLLGDGLSIDVLLIWIQIGAAVTFLCVLNMIPWGGAKYGTFGGVFLLVHIILKVLAAVDAYLYGSRIEYLPAAVYVFEGDLYIFAKSEFIANIGGVVLIVAWRIFVGNSLEETSFMSRTPMNIRIPLYVYLFAALVELVKNIFPGDLGVLTQLSQVTYALAIVSIYFLAMSRADKLGSVSLAGILGLPLSLMALGVGMKENIFFPVIPFVIVYLINYKSFLNKLFLLVTAVAILMVSQLYVSYVRAVTWGVDGDKSYNTSELVSGFINNMEKINLREDYGAISSRLNMTQTYVSTVYVADENGYKPAEIFGMIPASLVPRIFWPSKPTFVPGAMHTARVEGINVPVSEITTSTAAGFFAELYLGGWYIGWLIGSIFYGFLMAVCQISLLRRAYSFSCLSFSFVAVYWALRFDEKHVIYAYTSVIFTFSFILIVDRLFHYLRYKG